MPLLLKNKKNDETASFKRWWINGKQPDWSTKKYGDERKKI
jgi:hypothetical protein